MSEIERSSGKSELARIRQQIDAEHEAVQRIFNEPAIVAPHAFITTRMEQIAIAFQKRCAQEGEAAAFNMACAEIDAFHDELRRESSRPAPAKQYGTIQHNLLRTCIE